MPAAPLLPDAEIQARAASLTGWDVKGRELVRSFTFSDFGEAVAFVARLVEPADELDHHPDVSIHWNEVTLALWTHASGGITERDFSLAESIDRLVG